MILLNFHNENFGEGTNKEANCALVSWTATYLKGEKSYFIYEPELKQNDIEPKCFVYDIIFHQPQPVPLYIFLLTHRKFFYVVDVEVQCHYDNENFVEIIGLELKSILLLYYEK